MADDPKTNEPDLPPGDDSMEPDPVEAELIAYLDGELDPADERRIEERMAADPVLRARADALQRSYDLLEFLPKPEPSPTFASRTMDRLPAVKSGPSPRASSATAANTPAPPAGSSSVPVVLSSSAVAASGPIATPSGRGWVWAFGLLAAVAIAMGAGYLGASAAQRYLLSGSAGTETSPDNLSLADLRVIQNLPLYAPVDDLNFLEELGETIFYQDEARTEEPVPASPPEREKPIGEAFDQLHRAFISLPPNRQDRIRKLDHDLHEQPTANQAKLFRVLESYAAWLQRLPEAQRKEILAAATAEKRLEAIRDIRRAQWIARLPATMRQQLDNLPVEERAQLITQWRAEERQRREDWHIARANWEALRTGRPPWPFHDDRMKKEVLEFVTSAYHPEDPRRCRLSGTGPRGGDLGRLQEVLDRAEKGNEWALLGKVLFDLSQNPRYEMLPEPRNGMPVIEYEQLWPSAKAFYEKKAPRARLETALGKWPDFALAVWETTERSKALAPPPGFSFGPSRLIEFKPETARFVAVDLKKKATKTELNELARLEGKWPDYPRELIRIAKQHDLSVPGAMLPGPPSRWARTYNLARPPVRRPAK